MTIRHDQSGPPPLWPAAEPVADEPATPPRRALTVATRWVRWRALELACVAAPLVLTATLSIWFALAAPPVVAVWVWHEVRLARELPRHE